MIFLAVLLAVAGALSTHYSEIATVSPQSETEAVIASRGDKADDAAIWVHAQNPSLSLIIGTNKDSRGGLEVYDLSGKRLQFIQSGKMNNVDIRYGFPLGTARVDLVCATNRSNDSLGCYRIDPDIRRLAFVGNIHSNWSSGIYGVCMYKSKRTNLFYVIANDQSGQVRQFRLDGYSGRLRSQLVRRFEVGGKTEGCVADDDLGRLYIGEEARAVWRYSAEPDGDPVRTVVDTSQGNLKADIEGMTIYYQRDGTGYLIISSQGSSTFSVYTREGGNRYLGSFRIGSTTEGDSVSATDGVDVTSANLGASFPKGLLVAHDGVNAGARTTNFKLVSWMEVENSLRLNESER